MDMIYAAIGDDDLPFDTLEGAVEAFAARPDVTPASRASADLEATLQSGSVSGAWVVTSEPRGGVREQARVRRLATCLAELLGRPLVLAMAGVDSLARSGGEGRLEYGLWTAGPDGSFDARSREDVDQWVRARGELSVDDATEDLYELLAMLVDSELHWGGAGCRFVAFDVDEPHLSPALASLAEDVHAARSAELHHTDGRAMVRLVLHDGSRRVRMLSPEELAVVAPLLSSRGA